MEALLNTSAATKQTWLRTIRLAREIAEEDRQNDVAQMQSTLQQWLITRPQPERDRDQHCAAPTLQTATTAIANPIQQQDHPSPINRHDIRSPLA